MATSAAGRAVASAKTAVRWREWYASKVPFVWTACGAAVVGSRLSDGDIVRRVAIVTLFTCWCGAFGHVANDFADRASDGAAGKLAPAARMTTTQAASILVLLAIAAMGTLALLAASGDDTWRGTMVAGAATLALAAAYSLSPLRLKVRGSAGIWSAAAAQRTLPMLVAILAIGRIDAATSVLMMVGQLAGMRWMLVHQMLDADNDQRSGVATWVGRVGVARARTTLRHAVLPLEIILVLIAVALMATRTPLLWLLPMLGLVASGAWAWKCRGVQSPYSLEGYARQPLAGFYQAIWPLGLFAALALGRPQLWIVVVAMVTWQHRVIGHGLAEFLRLKHRRAEASVSPVRSSV